MTHPCCAWYDSSLCAWYDSSLISVPYLPHRQLVGWEAYDCTRGANIFGVASIVNAVINGQSGNVYAK